MRLHEIGQFYGERKGWRMFDSHALTPEIKNYLQVESSFLEELMQSGYKTLVEVGCGYGRYLIWALSRGYCYLGMDIVPWMVELGQMRSDRARKKFLQLSCGVVRHSAEEIARAVKELSLDHPEHKPLIFFPFNCLGNVSQFDTVMDSLADAGLDVLISTFKTDASSTRIRKEYYGQCGYEQLNSRILKQGLLIVSEEGFHAMAYHQDVLVNAFRKRGFELNKQSQTVTVGSILYFTCKKQLRAGVATEFEQEALSARGSIEVTAYSIENDPLTEDKIEAASTGGLLAFKETRITCKPLSADQFQGHSPVELHPGTWLRLVLPVVPPNSDKINQRLWYTDLVGEVVACTPSKDSHFELIVKLKKPEPGLLDKFVYS